MITAGIGKINNCSFCSLFQLLVRLKVVILFYKRTRLCCSLLDKWVSLSSVGNFGEENVSGGVDTDWILWLGVHIHLIWLVAWHRAALRRRVTSCIRFEKWSHPPNSWPSKSEFGWTCHASDLEMSSFLFASDFAALNSFFSCDLYGSFIFFSLVSASPFKWLLRAGEFSG